MMESMIHVPQALQQFFEAHRRVALAFSGGCDSAYLMYAAKSCNAEITAYTVHSQFQPRFELDDAARLADDLKCEMRVINADVLRDENVRRNSSDRCYYCKRLLLERILTAAAKDGYDTVIDGTNASDSAADRPGMRALSEMRVLSPLRMCGIDKHTVRTLSRRAGLFTWNKPAYACLATRLPQDTIIDEAALLRIEASENALSALGFADFRVRVTERGARIEVTEAQMPLAIEKREKILEALQKHYAEITLNLIPRKGSVDG